MWSIPFWLMIMPSGNQNFYLTSVVTATPLSHTIKIEQIMSYKVKLPDSSNGNRGLPSMYDESQFYQSFV